jgi:DNA-binding transcriptional regulator YiaG
MNKIREARKAAGLSQRRMAEVMGIPQRTIENWEAGVNDPPEYVERLIVQELERIKNDEKNS